MPYASVVDVEVQQGPVAADQVAKVETLLEQAEAQVRQRVPIEQRLTDGRTDVVLVRQVLVEMVTAVLANPDGVRSRTETAGPFTQTVAYGGSSTAAADAGFGRMTVTERHLVLLGERPAGAFTVTPGVRR